MRDNRLPGTNLKRATPMFHPERSLENNGEFIEFGRLSRLDPSLRTAHVRYASRGSLRIHSSDVFVDDLWLIARSLDTSRLWDESWHGLASGWRSAE